MGKTNRVTLHLVAFLLFIGYSLPNFSQHQVEGRVNDIEQRALPYASVRLLKTDSTYVSGITTDSLGCYRFANVASNKYLLAFSTIGYKPQIIPVTVRNADVTVPTVMLESDDVMLGEIVVKGSSFIRQKDRVLIIPDKQQVKHANTGYDLLYNLMIPSIDVNKRTGEVTTFGESVSLYINGEKADYRDVQSLRPRDIINVEYYDVPTGKYSGDVAAINYVTKQYSTGGYVSLDGKQTIGYLAGDYNVGAKISHGNTSYSVWGGYNMKDVEGPHTEKYESIYFPDYEVYRNRLTGSADNRSNLQYAQFKVSNITKKHNLSAQVSLVRDDVPEESSNDQLTYSGHYSLNSNSTEQKNSESLQPSVSLFGNFKLRKNQELEFKVKGSYTQNDYLRTYVENEQSSLSDVNEDMYRVEFSGKYTVKMKHQNSLNIALMHQHNISSSSYAGDYDSWQHLWSGESLLFLTYSQKWGKHLNLVFSPGMSMLNYRVQTICNNTSIPGFGLIWFTSRRRSIKSVLHSA